MEANLSDSQLERKHIETTLHHRSRVVGIRGQGVGELVEHKTNIHKEEMRRAK